MTVASTSTQDAVARYLDAFAARNPSGETGAVVRWRRAAMNEFARSGFPGPRDEAWRQTDPRPFSRAFAPAARPTRDDSAMGSRLDEIRLVDGVRVRGTAPAGWADCVSWGQPADIDIVEAPAETRSAFALLNIALFPELTDVRVPAGATLSTPLRLDHLTRLDGEPRVAFPRIHVDMGENAEATLVESYESVGRGDGMTDAVTSVHLAPGARFTHVRHQHEDVAALHIGQLVVRQEERATFTSHVVSTGARLSRVDVDVTFLGEGCEANLRGLFGGAGHQHVDTHTRVDHAHAHGTSRQVYKGILGDSAHGVFHGRVLVRPDAQRTDARQTNKNLLLSDEAHVDSTPQLEIRADDVRCMHGSTIGQLEEDALFYLRSRGLGVPEATRLLVHAFAFDVVQQVPDARVVNAATRFIGRVLEGVKIPGASR